MRYRYNPYCSCPRCRAHGYMGPAVLITLGVLFLLAQVTSNYWLNFDRTWPALLIVIGLVSFLRHSAPANGHVPREYAAPPAPAVYPPRPVAPGPGAPGAVVTPPPAQPAGSLPAAPYGQSGSHPSDTGVHNG
jgi:hypothetical protein